MAKKITIRRSRSGKITRSSSSAIPANQNTLNLRKFTKKLRRNSQPALDFVSSPTFIELALLGAAGFVIWNNREKIQSFLDDKGIDIPGAVSDKFNQWFGSEEEVARSGRSYAQ